MKKINSLLAVLAFFLNANSQVDVFDYKVVSVIALHRTTNYENYYAKIPHQHVYGNLPYGTTSYSIKNYVQKDGGNGYGVRLNYLELDEKSVIEANGESVLYYIFLALNGKFQDENSSNASKLFTTRSNKLSGSSFNSNIDLSLSSRFWNYNFIDISGLGGKKFIGGVNFTIKYIGLNGPITYFSDDNPDIKQAQVYSNMSETVFDSRVLLGPVIGYRNNLGKNLALYATTGVKFCANLNNPQLKLNYNPFLKTQIYFGKNMGLFVGCYFDYLKSKYYYDGTHASANISNPQEGIDMKVSTLEFQVGFYYKAGWFRKFLTRSRN